jgi:hypothetical protein
MKNSTYSRCSQTVSTVKKSHATIPAACWRRNVYQVVAAARRRAGVQPMAAQRGADHRRREAHTQVEQLALDALRAPGRVLPGEADDQLLQLLVQLRSPWSAVRVGPCAGHEPPVPAQERLGRDEEARPTGPGEHPADHGEQGPVAGPEFGSCALAAEARRADAAGRGSQGPWQRHRERAARAAGWSGTA